MKIVIMLSDMKDILKKQIYLYTNKGKSCREVSEILGRNYDTVKKFLWQRGLLRRAMGRDIEDKVCTYFINKGNKVIRQKGDRPFDLILNGLRVDVKSATIGKDKRYKFQLQDKTAYGRKTSKDIQSEVDYFILVFLSEPMNPMYRIMSIDITAKVSLNILPNPNKYPIKFIDYLD